MAAGSRNPHLIGMKEDNLYHIGIKADTSTQEIKEKFGDVKVLKIPVPSISKNCPLIPMLFSLSVWEAHLIEWRCLRNISLNNSTTRFRQAFVSVTSLRIYRFSLSWVRLLTYFWKPGLPSFVRQSILSVIDCCRICK